MDRGSVAAGAGREAAVTQGEGLRPPERGLAKGERLEQAHQTGGHAENAAGGSELVSRKGQQPEAQHECDNRVHMRSFLFGRR